MKALLLSVMLMGSTCAHVDPPQPTPAPQPTLPPLPGEPSCDTACARAVTLGCSAGPDCSGACRNVQDSGVFVLDVRCLTAASSCAAWRACSEVR